MWLAINESTRKNCFITKAITSMISTIITIMFVFKNGSFTMRNIIRILRCANINSFTNILSSVLFCSVFTTLTCFYLKFLMQITIYLKYKTINRNTFYLFFYYFFLFVQLFFIIHDVFHLFFLGVNTLIKFQLNKFIKYVNFLHSTSFVILLFLMPIIRIT